LHAFTGNVSSDGGVFVFAANLVDFINVDDALLCAFDVAVGSLQKLEMMFSTSSPTYPASVRVVASTIVNGTLNKRASVCASSVLPVPVGPISRMFAF